MSRWLWALLGGVVLIAIAAVFWTASNQTHVPPAVSPAPTPVAPAPAPAPTAQNVAPPLPAPPPSPAPPAAQDAAAPPVSTPAAPPAPAPTPDAGQQAASPPAPAPSPATPSAPPIDAQQPSPPPAPAPLAEPPLPPPAPGRQAQEVAGLYAPKNLTQLVGTWAYSPADCDRLFQRRGGGWAFRQPVDKFAQAAIVELPKRIVLPSAICQIRQRIWSGRRAQGERRMPGLDQLHAPERDDRAALRHRTYLQRFRRSGARHNPQEMPAVTGKPRQMLLAVEGRRAFGRSQASRARPSHPTGRDDMRLSQGNAVNQRRNGSPLRTFSPCSYEKAFD